MRIIWRFMRYPLRYRWRLASVYVFMVGNVAGQWLLPVLLGTAVDDALTSGLGSDRLQLGAIILGVAVSKAGFSFGASYIQQIIIARVQEDIRNDIFRKLLGLSFSFYDRNRTGDLMSRAMNDARSVGDTVPASTHRFIATALLLVAIGTFVLVTNWHLGLVVIAFVVLYMWRSFGEGGRLEAIYGRLAERSGNLAAVIQENISGARAVKAFGAGDYEESKFAAEASAVAREGFAADKVSNIQAALLMAIMTVTTGAVLWFGGR